MHMKLEEQIRKYIDSQSGDIAVVAETLEGNFSLELNATRVFPSASTIKLVIMIELFKQAKDGKLSLSDKLTLSSEKTGGDGILKELDAGHQFSLLELCTLMIIVSDNMATNILIDHLGMSEINAQAASLGLSQTSLQRKMMDSAAVKAGRNNYISAEDFAKIIRNLYRGQIISPEASAAMLDILKRQQVRGRLDLYLPEDLHLAHKTGDLDFLEHDGGILYLPDQPLLLCVLTENVQSNQQGREIIATIAKMVFEAFQKP